MRATTTIARAFAVTRGTRLDLTDAERYGRVTYLFDRFDVSPMTGDDFMTAVEERLRALDFDPRYDCFIVAGPVVPVTLAFNALWQYVKQLDGFGVSGQFTALMYEARDSAYVARRITV